MSQRLIQILALTLCGLSLAAQEHQPLEKAVEVGEVIRRSLPELEGLPVAMTPDWKKPYLMTGDGTGVLVAPASGLAGMPKLEEGKEVGLGFLWALKVAPKVKGQVVPESGLWMMDIQNNDSTDSHRLAFLPLTLMKKGKAIHLRMHGRDKTLVHSVELIEYRRSSQVPIELDAELKEEHADLYLHLFGTHEAVIELGELE